MADALHTPGVVTAAEARLDDAGLIAVQGPTALDARTGVLVGPGTTTLVTGTAATAPMQYSIAPHHWVTSRGVNSDGVYRGTNEAVQLVSTTAAPGSGSRIDVIYEKQGDANSTITPDGATAPVYGVVQGTSTTGTPTKPAIPVGALELGTATVAAGATATNGSGVVITNTARQTSTRGGVILCRTQAERVALTTFATLQALELDKGRLLWHDGTKFRYDGDHVIVGSSAERDALTAYVGLRALNTATGQTWENGAGGWDVADGPSPRYRVVRAAAAVNYSSAAFVNVPYDALDAAQSNNPDNAYFAAALTLTDRRVQCLKGGLYHFEMEIAGTGTIGGTRIGLMTGVNTMGATIATSSSNRVSGSWRLNAGDFVGAAVIESGSDAPDAATGFHNHLVITRLSA